MDDKPAAGAGGGGGGAGDAAAARGTPTGGPREPDPREASTRAKNRAALAWVVAACLALSALGFLFALWLRGRPGPS